MNIKEEALYFLSCIHFNYKPQKIEDICDLTISAKPANITHITNHTCNLDVIEINGEKYFFRPCRLRVEKKKFLDTVIEEYFRNVNDKDEELSGEFFIKSQLSDKSHYRYFINMGTKMDFNSPIHKFQSSGDYQLLGIATPSAEIEGQIQQFIQFFCNELYNYKLNSGTRVGDYQIFGAERQIATQIIAKKLKLERLICGTKIVCIKNNGALNYGTLMKSASGYKSSEFGLQARKEKITPQLQCELSDLNILDVITHEKDHRPNNYNVVLNDQNLFVSIEVFDNDCPVTFFPDTNIGYDTFCGCSPFVKGNYINRPYLNKMTVENILNVDINDILMNLKPYLSFPQLWAIKKRFEKLQKIIRVSIRDNRVSLLKPNEFDNDTLNEELSGKYGDTYIVKLVLNDWCKK